MGVWGEKQVGVAVDKGFDVLEKNDSWVDLVTKSGETVKLNVFDVRAFLDNCSVAYSDIWNRLMQNLREKSHRPLWIQTEPRKTVAAVWQDIS